MKYYLLTLNQPGMMGKSQRIFTGITNMSPEKLILHSFESGQELNLINSLEIDKDVYQQLKVTKPYLQILEEEN